MLNGVAPIIIFHFYNKDVSGLLSGIPFGSEIGAAIGIPVPIYLDENITGIYVQDETKSIDFITEVEPVLDKDLIGDTKAPLVKQTALDSQVNISLTAKKDSIMLVALLALGNLAFKKAVSQDYGITYLNKSTTIFNGLLQRFSTSVGVNDDLIRIDMTLSDAKQEGTEVVAATAAPVIPIPRPIGEVPL